MLITTTSTVPDKEIVNTLGFISSEVIVGANAVKDMFASFTDFFGGRSSSYENALIDAKAHALEELIGKAKSLGANAIIGVYMSYASVGKN